MIENITQYIKDNDFVPLFVRYKGKVLPTLGYYLNRNGVFIRVTANNEIKFLKYCPDKDGYNRQAISTVGGTKMCRLAILVAQTFIPNPDPKRYTMVNHKNLIKNDDRVENLEWVTPQQNVDHYNRNRRTAPTRKDYPILQCKVIADKTLQIIRRYETIKDVPAIGFDGRLQQRNKITHCCLDDNVQTFHRYAWLYEKDRPEKETQGFTFIN